MAVVFAQGLRACMQRAIAVRMWLREQLLDREEPLHEEGAKLATLEEDCDVAVEDVRDARRQAGQPSEEAEPGQPPESDKTTQSAKTSRVSPGPHPGQQPGPTPAESKALQVKSASKHPKHAEDAPSSARRRGGKPTIRWKKAICEAGSLASCVPSPGRSDLGMGRFEERDTCAGAHCQQVERCLGVQPQCGVGVPGRGQRRDSSGRTGPGFGCANVRCSGGAQGRSTTERRSADSGRASGTVGCKQVQDAAGAGATPGLATSGGADGGHRARDTAARWPRQHEGEAKCRPGVTRPTEEAAAGEAPTASSAVQSGVGCISVCVHIGRVGCRTPHRCRIGHSCMTANAESLDRYVQEDTRFPMRGSMQSRRAPHSTGPQPFTRDSVRAPPTAQPPPDRSPARDTLC